MAEGNLSFEELEVAANPQEAAKPAEATATPAEAQPAEASKPQFTDADVEAYKQLVDLGINPQNAQEFKAAKNALDNLPVLLKNNPNLLLDEIEKNDPELHKQLLEAVSDRWFNRLPADVRNGSANGSPSRSTESSPALEAKISKVEAQLEGFIQKQNREESAKQQEAISSGFQSSMDKLIGKLPESVSERDKDYIRLKTNELIWRDSSARDRVAKGVYVDVPTYFSKASSLVTAETKAASNAEHERRAGVEARGVKEIPAAAENVNGSAATKQEGHGHDPIWGDISPTELKSAYK